MRRQRNCSRLTSTVLSAIRETPSSTNGWTAIPKRMCVYGFKNGEHPSPDFPKMKQSKIMGESILCGQCHGQGPNFSQDNPTQCATLYGSYNFAYIPEGERETCQECHIKKSKLGHNMQSYRSKKWQRWQLICMSMQKRTSGVMLRRRPRQRRLSLN